MVDFSFFFSVCCHINFFCLFVFHIQVVSDKVLLFSDLLLKTVFSQTHCQAWLTHNRVAKSWVSEAQLCWLKPLKVCRGVWFVFLPKASSGVGDQWSATTLAIIWKSFRDAWLSQVLLAYVITSRPADPWKDPCSPHYCWDSNNQGSFWMFQLHCPNKCIDTHTHTTHTI